MCENKRTEGFTLAELLIVVAIIGVLVAVSIPIFTSQLEKSKQATDLANMRSAKAAAIAEWMTEGMPDWSAGNHYYDAASGRIVTTAPNGYGKSSKKVTEFNTVMEHASGVPNPDEPNFITISITTDGIVDLSWGTSFGNKWNSIISAIGVANDAVGTNYKGTDLKNMYDSTYGNASTADARKAADIDALNAIANTFIGKTQSQMSDVYAGWPQGAINAASSNGAVLFNYRIDNGSYSICFDDNTHTASYLTEVGYTGKKFGSDHKTKTELGGKVTYLDRYIFTSDDLIKQGSQSTVKIKVSYGSDGKIETCKLWVDGKPDYSVTASK